MRQLRQSDRSGRLHRSDQSHRSDRSGRLRRSDQSHQSGPESLAGPEVPGRLEDLAGLVDRSPRSGQWDLSRRRKGRWDRDSSMRADSRMKLYRNSSCFHEKYS